MQRLNKLVAAALALVTVLVLCPSAAYAAQKVSAKYFSTKSTTSKIMNGAPAITTGTTTVKVPKKRGWVKFTAPESKTYTFTLSGATTKGSKSVIGVQMSKMTRTKFSILKLKTTEGKRTYLVLSDVATAKKYTKARLIYNKLKHRYLATRTVTVKLDAGESVYLSLAAANSKGAVAGTLSVSVK